LPDRFNAIGLQGYHLLFNEVVSLATNRQLCLRNRPDTMPQADKFEIGEATVPELAAVHNT
jgi:hypothetical protein